MKPFTYKFIFLDFLKSRLFSAVFCFFITAAYLCAENSSIRQAVASDGVTTVFAPFNVLPVDSSIKINLISDGPIQFHQLPQFVSVESITTANEKLGGVLGDFAQAVTVREFAAIDSQGRPFSERFGSPVTIVMPYSDNDNDGVVDGVYPKIKAEYLSAYVLDEALHIWRKIPSSIVDKERRIVTIKVNHFSVYALFGAADNDVSQTYAFPVPFKPGSGHKQITFSNLPSSGHIGIYTATGELVKKIDFNILSGESKVNWNVKNSDGEDVASDVYLFVIDSNGNKKTGKIIVVR